MKNFERIPGFDNSGKKEEGVENRIIDDAEKNVKNIFNRFFNLDNNKDEE